MRTRECERRKGSGGRRWRTAIVLVAVAAALLPLRGAAQLSTTTVQGTVYRADGAAASGTLLVSWSAFTTPQNQAIAAGHLSTAIGADGFVSVNLTPNAGAQPAGSYYTAVYHLNDGTVNQEYWVVPASGTASVAGVRAQLEPSTVAVQPVSQAYVNSAVASISTSFLPLTGGTLNGPLTLSADPIAASQAATKHYADAIGAASLPVSGGTVAGALDAEELEGDLFAEQWQSGSSTNDGIRLSLAECAKYSYACQVVAPAIYAQTEAEPWGGFQFGSNGDYRGPAWGAAPGCAVDKRYGPPQYICNSGPNPNGNRFSSGFGISQRIISVPQGLAAHPGPGLSVITNLLTGSRDGDGSVGDQVGPAGIYDLFTQDSPSSPTALSVGLNANSSGDHLGESVYITSRAGITAGDNEGVENQMYSQEAPDVVQGRVNSMAAEAGTTYPDPCTGPCTVLNTTQTQGSTGAWGGDLELIDVSKGDSSGYISQISSNTVTAAGADWDTKYGDSSAHTTTAAAIGDGTSTTNIFPAANYTVPVTSSSGFATGPACLFDSFGGNYECEQITAVGSNTLTFAVINHAFYSGATVAQGGMTGMGIRFTADCVGGSYGMNGRGGESITNADCPTWPIMYNAAGGVATVITGNRVAFSTTAYPQMGSGGTAAVTVSGGQVTGCTVSGGSGYGSQTDAFGHLTSPPQLAISGITSTTAPVIYVAGTSAGALATCGIASAGAGISGTPTVTVTPTNGYTVYPMARTVNAWNPATGAVDGSSIAVDTPMPAASAWASGDTVEQPHWFATVYTLENDHQYTYQPGQADNGMHLFTLGGYFNYYEQVANANSPTLYQNYPGGATPYVPGNGRLGTPYGITFAGPWANGLYFQNMPAFGSSGSYNQGAVVVNCGSLCSTWNNWSQMLTHRNGNNGNLGEDVLAYNPSTYAWQWTAGAMHAGGTTPYCSVNLTGAAGGGLSVACNGYTSKLDTSGNLSLPGSLRAQGGVSGATINGEITVDGLTYTSLNAAWAAAVNQANTSGQNQTVRLGPGAFSVSATLTEPANGACVSLLGSGGTTMTADSTQAATTLTVPAPLGGDIFYLGNAAQAQGCTFRDLNILAQANATHGFELQWFRGALIDNVTVNDTTAEGILLGEENTAAGHQANFLLRNVTVSYSSAAFTPGSRPAYGIHLEKTAMDSHLDDIVVRNALTAAIYNEGSGNTGYLIHGFGYPYTCATGPCANNTPSSSSANASYASSYVIYDTGGAGSVWTDTYGDSPAVAAFYVGANGIAIHGGHIQWPDVTSFPAANLAYVAAAVTNNLLIADVDCLEMAPSVNWITYAGTAGNPPSFSSVHHLTGCGNYYQALEPAEVTGFSSGGANINDPSGAVPRVWSTPVSAAASYPAYAAQMYTGYQGDAYQAHFSGSNPFFDVTYQGTIRTNGGIALSTIINTAATLTLTAANKNVIANAAGGAQTITLPSCYTALPDKASPTGLEFTIIKSDTSANAVTLQTVSSQNINYLGVSAQTLAVTSPGKRTVVCGPDYNWYAY